jgi:hypothetical protein
MTRYMDFKQTTVIKTTVAWIITRPEFWEGVKDARAGLPFREIGGRREQWFYERGRLLGLLYKGPIRNRQGEAHYRAVAAYKLHRRVNAII